MTKIDSSGDYLDEALRPYPNIDGGPIKERYITYADGSYCIIRVDALRRIQGEYLFDEELFAYLEDALLGVKLWNHGYKVESINIIGGRHLRGSSFGTASRLYQSVKNRTALHQVVYTKFGHLYFYRNFILGLLYSLSPSMYPLRTSSYVKAFMDGFMIGSRLKKKGIKLNLYKAPYVKLSLLKTIIIPRRKIRVSINNVKFPPARAWIRKRSHPSDSGKVKFVVVYNNSRIFKNCFASSPYISPQDVIAYHNVSNESLPKIFNQIVQKHLHENVWFAFCHQDFILKEDLQLRLKGKEVEAIYGPIGNRPSANKLLGMITQTDGTEIGSELKDDAPVQTLDEMCLIVNSEVFRQGLLFDERFRFHFYGADLCMQASLRGFDVLAMQMKCQHKSRTLIGDMTSPEYLSSKKIFTEKWKQHKPIATTTTFIS